jgi:hypothetical protein
MTLHDVAFHENATEPVVATGIRSSIGRPCALARMVFHSGFSAKPATSGAVFELDDIRVDRAPAP